MFGVAQRWILLAMGRLRRRSMGSSRYRDLATLLCAVSRDDRFHAWIALRGTSEQSAEHEWGWVVGLIGFHEFVIIDRAAAMLTLLIASDD
jgi:hypothetical protein